MKIIVNGKEYTIKPDANLSGTNLSEADLSNADLNSTLYDDNTKFPDGFTVPENLY